MSAKHVKTNKGNTNSQHIFPISWVVWLVVSMIIGAVGGYIMVTAGFKFNYLLGYVETTPACYFSLVLFLISGITSIICIKEMIAESHVRALEVYYGERRKIKRW